MRRFSPLPSGGEERGVVAVWLAITLVVLLGFAGWAIDFAHWKSDATKMQRAADAAALAGAVYLPDDPAGAIAAAKQVASQNGYSSGVSATTLDSANQLKVTINSNVKSDFAKVIGISSAISTGDTGGGGIGFAIPINAVKDVVAQLKAKGRVEHPFLGLR